jgi:hypothetical protein
LPSLLPTPRLLASAYRLRRQLKQKVTFSQEMNRRPISHHPHKVVAIIHIAFHHFSLLPSPLLLPSPFTAQWLTPLFMPSLPPLLHRPALMTRGEKRCDGDFFLSNSWCHKNSEGGDFRTHQLLQEDDRGRRRPSGIPRPWMVDG